MYKLGGRRLNVIVRSIPSLASYRLYENGPAFGLQAARQPEAVPLWVGLAYQQRNVYTMDIEKSYYVGVESTDKTGSVAQH